MSALPLLPTSVVGSHGKPAWWFTLVKAHEAGEAGPGDLEEMFDDAADTAIRDMERAGLDIITDGEVRRLDGYVDSYYAIIKGIEPLPVRRKVGPWGYDQQTRYEATGRIETPEGGLGIVKEFQYLKAHTTRAGGLGGAGGVGLEVLELLDDAEPALRGLDAAGGLVARLLIVAPRSHLAPDRQGLDPLDDRVVGVDVAVEPAHLAVGDDVETGPLHVADRGVGRVVEHLLDVPGTHLPRLVGLDRGVPPAGLAVRADDAGGDQRKSGHLRVLLWVVSVPRRARTLASMLSPAPPVNGGAPPPAVGPP